MQKNPKFLCNYGGKFIPRYFDGKLRYFGGQTRVLAVDRSISFSAVITKLGEFTGEPGLCPLTLRCQLLEPDLDYALVSIVFDEDLSNLIEEYDLVSSMKILLSFRFRGFNLPLCFHLLRRRSNCESSSKLQC
ncbi:hypothetical protein LINPERPRIM_LOCUS17034 [Linum perenne]